MKKRPVVVVIGLILVVCLLGSGWWNLIGQSLPAYSGNITIPGLREGVDIYRDDYGVPHIYASNMNDLVYAQGYVQAQDRLWEMDLMRRMAQGRLSEIFGESQVKTDKYFLSIGLYEAARQSYPAYSEQTRSYVDSYVAGINRYMQECGTKLPPEFKLLGYQPEPWKPVDSLCIGKYMSYGLGGNMNSELLYLNLAGRVSSDKLKERFPGYPDNAITIMKEAWREKAIQTSSAQLKVSPEKNILSQLLNPSPGLGSNNWVVSGKMTRSGKPIVCSDMHLDIMAPSVWYQNHLVIPGQMNVTGVIFPGVGGVIAGHNDKIAWAETNVNPDVQDLYLEKRNPQNPNQFLYQGKWEEGRIVKYEIKVKGKKTIDYSVTYTRHGPIIKDGVELAKGRDLALKWTALEPSCELDAVLGMDTARNWNDFKKALESFKAPAQNFIFADVDGNIAYRANGLIPIRARGNGLMPVPGWTGTFEWKGYIPWNELPQMVNPAEGLIVTANNKVIDDTYPYYISNEWCAPYRAQSIKQSLQGRTGLTLQQVMKPQTNWDNLQAKLLYPILREALSDTRGMNTEEKEASRMMLKWAAKKPVDDPTKAEPAIYHTLYVEIIKATVQDEMGPKLMKDFMQNDYIVTNNFDQELLEGKSSWFDNTRTPVVENRNDIIRTALKNTVSRLNKESGKDIEDWKWGSIHTITFDHPMGQNAFLRPFFNKGPYSYGGSCITSGAGWYDYSTNFEITIAAPWRYGVDLATMEGRDIMAGGVSGHPGSSHYHDQMQLWLNGNYKELLFDDETIKKECQTVTHLEPAGKI
ncbi:MAG: penicillin acylase family protein [Chitinophagales bacterium]